MRFDVEDHGENARMKIAFDQQDLVTQSPRQAPGGVKRDCGASASGFGRQERYQVLLYAVSQLMYPAEDAGLKSVDRHRGNQQLRDAGLFVQPFHLIRPAPAKADNGYLREQRMNQLNGCRGAVPVAEFHKNEVGIVSVQKNGELIVRRKHGHSLLNDDQS